MKPQRFKSGRDLAALLALSVAVPELVLAAAVDISNGPLSSGVGGATVVKPNIALVVDDSTSMEREYMPDTSTASTRRCYGWYGYNTIAYNPTVVYKPPYKIGGTVYSDGVTRYPDAVFSSALNDGYFPQGGYTYGGNSTSNTTTDLNTPPLSSTTDDPNTWNNANNSRYYYSTTTGTSSNCTSNTYVRITSAANIAAPGVANGSAEAKTNYANWYSYYRNRAGVMKAAAGEAFSNLEAGKYRVGQFYLNSTDSGSGSATSNTDLKIADFDGTQRTDWYDKLYSARTKSSGTAYTPLRGALSRMGRMYAGKIAGWDPVQYSCQQNFTILSTDGVWNSNSETTTYGPKQIGNSTNVGDADKMATPGVGASSSKKLTFASNTCYTIDSLTVSVAGTSVQLLDSAPLASQPSCSGNAAAKTDAFGAALAASINGGSSGFTALYNSTSDVIRVTAPASLGNFTATPNFVVKAGATAVTTFALPAFSGGSAPGAGAGRPYGDDKGASNTLADVAYYYYGTDLRTTALSNCSNTIDGTVYNNLCQNNVMGGGKDTSDAQHMTTFTIGLGVNGSITYESNYETAGDIAGVTQYYDILNGGASWPNPNTDENKIDDLWHAAVNGRGTYYNASNAETLRKGLEAALAGVKARTGASAAAATSNLEPVAGDNYVYVALYRTQKWDGDLKAFQIDPDTGALTGTEEWSAQAKIDEQVANATTGDGRKIVYFRSGATNNLKEFTAANLQADGLATHYANFCTDKNGTQCASLNTAQVAVADTPASLVSYLRGSKTFEDVSGNPVADNKVYRDRDHVLGDIVNAVPVYMKKPPFSYDKYDATYSTFKTTHQNRAPTVYVAANDGMLHAINAVSDSNAADYGDRGKERWAYVPGAVMKNMWKLADSNYGNNHTYFVDGSPTVADICVTLANGNSQMCSAATDWRTILVGGLNKGGCSYYALDVTDPTNPKGMWEFSHPNLGYSFGNPIVGKNKAGKWVVIITSGYNNVAGANDCSAPAGNGDGNGHVFVLDAATGALLSAADAIPTLVNGAAVGDSTTPSGLAKLNAWIENPDMPIIDRLYGGDLLGNLWRFDFDNNYDPNGKEATLLANFSTGAGPTAKPQPITIKPELGVVKAGGTNHTVVMVGTGKYLGINDLADTSQQSIYAVKDTLGTTGIANPRGGDLAQRTLVNTVGLTGDLAGKNIRTITGNNINWQSDKGWYVDLNPGNATPGERVNVDMSLQFNILTAAANIPENNACVVGGSAILYFLDINTGLNLSTAQDGMAGMRLGSNALVAGIKTLRLTSGKTVTVVTDTAGGVSSVSNPSPTGSGSGAARRTTWREVPN